MAIVTTDSSSFSMTRFARRMGKDRFDFTHCPPFTATTHSVTVSAQRCPEYTIYVSVMDRRKHIPGRGNTGKSIKPNSV